jgi:hypothetical protein
VNRSALACFTSSVALTPACHQGGGVFSTLFEQFLDHTYIITHPEVAGVMSISARR